MVTTLFFMWGFLTSLNDILIPHLKSIFQLNYGPGDAGAIRVFHDVCAAGDSVGQSGWSGIGYKKTMVAGLLTMGVGAILFVPARKCLRIRLFLAALIVLAGRNHGSAGGGESLRHGAGSGTHSLEPAEPDAGV